MLLFPLLLVLDHLSDIALDFSRHLFLHLCEQFPFLVQLFGFANDLVFLSVKPLIYITLFALLLQKPDCLHGPLALDDVGSDFVHVAVL